MKNIVFALSLLFFTTTLQGQVLISLLFGDKLNSGKIEFGLEGGLVNSNITNLDGAERTNGFDLGYYFDFKIKEKFFIHTGMIVKSPLGAEGLEPYSTGDPTLDLSLADGEVSRNFRSFDLPILAKYKFSEHLFIEGGAQAGLTYKAFDEFTATSKSEGEITYRNSIIKDTRKIDAGLAAGLGYRILKNNGLNIGARYFYGLVNTNKNNDLDAQSNNGIYFYAGIPVGVEKSKQSK